MTPETYDMMMLALLLAGAALGAWKGLVWQVASLVGIGASYWVAYSFCRECAAWLPISAPWNVLLAMFILFVLTWVGIWILYRGIATSIDRLRLKQFDRHLGALLGCVKGLILCIIITLLAVTVLGERQRQMIAQSRSGFSVGAILSGARRVLPRELDEVLGPHIEQLHERLD